MQYYAQILELVLSMVKTENRDLKMEIVRKKEVVLLSQDNLSAEF